MSDEESRYPKIRIGMFGLGTVGQGVMRYLAEKYTPRKTGYEIEVGKICVAHPDKKRKVQVDPALLTTNPDDILKDPSIDVVVELIGGIEPAGPYIMRALQEGKHVVTANKALLTHEVQKPHSGKPMEATRLIDQGKWPDWGPGCILFYGETGITRNIGFEASVCGELPIIDTVARIPSSTDIITIEGIVNGTCNYILSRMSGMMPYEDALRFAKELGLAEADESLDVDGIDAAQKLVLLSTLIFGKPTRLSHVRCDSIRKIAPADIYYSHKFGYEIKQIALANQYEDGDIELSVGPTLVPIGNILADVDDQSNIVNLYLKGRDDPIFIGGRGAGMEPTAQSVIQDIVTVVRDSPESRSSMYNLFLPDSEEREPAAYRTQQKWYIRLDVDDRARVLERTSGALGQAGIDVASMIQEQEQRKGTIIPMAFITHPAYREQVDSGIENIMAENQKEMPFVHDHVVMRVKD
jgi:homoserine dehydrogenase